MISKIFFSTIVALLLSSCVDDGHVPENRARPDVIDDGGIDALTGRSAELVDELGALGDPDSLWHYAQFDLLVNDRPEEAEAVLDIFLRLYPESARGHLLLAEAHRDLGQLDLARDDVRRSLDYDSRNEKALSLEDESLQITAPQT